MNKQTAVEWLIDQLTPSISLQQKHIDELKNQAKEMEKEQIIDAYKFGLSDEYVIGSQKYYNETYGGNNE
jgi:hypothetical protein